MPNILIIYATKHQQTAKIARRLTLALRAHGHTVELRDADAPDEHLDLTSFNQIIVAAPIHAGGYPKSIVRFVREHASTLSERSNVFCSIGLAIASRTSDGRAQTQVVVDKFVRQTGWHPGRVAMIAGALRYSQYNFLLKLIMRRIARQEGGATDTSRDYEYTDWEAVDRLADELSAAA